MNNINILILLVQHEVGLREEPKKGLNMLQNKTTAINTTWKRFVSLIDQNIWKKNEKKYLMKYDKYYIIDLCLLEAVLSHEID